MKPGNIFHEIYSIGAYRKGESSMTDERIVELYWNRDENAVKETQSKYGRYLTKIAYNILTDMEDSLESVNDTYMYAWKSIPPHRPSVLSTYLAKITRRVAIDILRKKNRDKRIPSEYTFSLSELDDCISDKGSTEQQIEAEELARIINAYLKTISPEARNLFVGRYYFLDPLKDVAKYCGMSEGKAKTMLYRTRCGLKAYLEQEGYYI